jgi:hypothetical protein
VITSRRMTGKGHVARMGDMGNSYKILVGKHRGKELFGRPKWRWENNIRMDLIGRVGECGLNWSDAGWRPMGGCCKYGNELPVFIKGGNFLTSWVTVGFSTMTLLQLVIYVPL